MIEPNYTEFSDLRLVAIYDTVNPIDSYEAFYTELATKLSASSIVDFGCGSGLLTCALAKRGHDVIGIEPSGRMLELARKRSGCENVRFLEGGADQLGDIKTDLIILTGHVAQFFLKDEDWQTTLSAFHKALKPGGHIAFESRNPLVLPFATWPTEENHKELTERVAGRIEWWAKILEAKSDRVRYEIHYLFTKNGEELVSTNELKFRSQSELQKSLEGAGLTVKNVYGNWDGSPATSGSAEMIFVAGRD